MNYFRYICLFLITWAVWPFSASAEEEGEVLSALRDSQAGYLVPLPNDWLEVADPAAREEILKRMNFLFTPEEGARGVAHIRYATQPNDEKAAPALVVFTLDYEKMGLTPEVLNRAAQGGGTLVKHVFSALLGEYKQLFPNTVLVNSMLDDDAFYFHLRSVLDPHAETASTRHRYMKFIFGGFAASVVMAQYEGPQDVDYELAISRTVRNSVVLPEYNFRSRLPPYQSSFLDYVLIAAALFFGLYCFGKLRAWMRK